MAEGAVRPCQRQPHLDIRGLTPEGRGDFYTQLEYRDTQV
jgi:hypothetical protein